MKINSIEMIKKLREKKKHKKSPTSFSVSDEVTEAFKAKCTRHGLSASEVVQELMEAFLAR